MSKCASIALNKNVLKASSRQEEHTIQNISLFLRDAYVSQLELCDMLESIADALPERPHNCVIQMIVRVHEGSWAEDILEEEEKLFVALNKHAGPNEFVKNLVKRMRLERQSDSDLSGELLSALQNLQNVKKIRDPEAFGYMLRGVFETKRRQIELKKEVVLPLGEQLLRSGQALFCDHVKRSNHQKQ